VRCELDLDEHLPPVLAEPIQIQQVIVNLLRNSVEAMESKPRDGRLLSIRSEKAPEGVRVIVTDTGCGIPPAITARLFEPFQTTKTAGMGIGLSICQRLVQSHGGSIATRPNPLGGTVFDFVIPVAENEQIDRLS
jgi:two-component system sensor kinase FixL